jgi:hypothetical protein
VCPKRDKIDSQHTESKTGRVIESQSLYKPKSTWPVDERAEAQPCRVLMGATTYMYVQEQCPDDKDSNPIDDLPD